MPKIVDHAERRRHIADAVFRLVGDHGLAGTGLREVAAEAHVSMGAVQHYFSTKEEMLLFALNHMTERVLARLSKDLAASQPTSHRQVISAAVRAMLPLNKPSREEAAVNIAFFAAALGNPRYQQLLRDGYRRLLDTSIQHMRDAANAGELAPGIDPDHEAVALFYLTQGLIGPLLIGVHKRNEALAILEARLTAVFTEAPPAPC